MVALKDGHITIDNELVLELFGNEEHINMVYYPERKNLLIAARSKTFFEKLHKTFWTVLKFKNARGDKTIFVRNLLIDNDLDETDKPLDYEVKSTGILSILLV